MKVAFLDRDGTINVNLPVACHVTRDWVFIPHVVSAMQLLRDKGFRLAIVTNRRGIAQGFYTLDQMAVLDRWLIDYLKQQNIYLEKIAYCPHAPDENCECRKPKIGLAKQVEEVVGAIDYPNSWMIGDKPTDVQFGKTLGMHTGLIQSEYWTNPGEAEIVGDSLYSIVQNLSADN